MFVEELIFDILHDRRGVEHAGDVESLKLEGDIGGGIVLERQINISKENPKVFRIDSAIVARSVGAGSGGFSRFPINTYTLLSFYIHKYHFIIFLNMTN